MEIEQIIIGHLKQWVSTYKS